MSRRRFIGFSTLILLAFFVTRLFGLLTLPLFMDEATHLTRSQGVWQGTPLELITTGKALGPYFAALFYPFEGAIWIGRFVVVLISGVGLASVIVLGRTFHSRGAGIVAGALWVLSPYLFFFERMALVDTTLASMAALTAYLAIRMIRTGQARDAVWCGIGMALCVAAKATGIAFFVLPGMAWMIQVSGVRYQVSGGSQPPSATSADRRNARSTPPRHWWRGGWGVRLVSLRQPFIAYLVAALLLALPVLYIVGQSANVLGVGQLSSVEGASLGTRLQTNPGIAWGAFRDYFQPAFWGVLMIMAGICVVYRPRVGVYLAALVIVPLAALFVTATNLYLRYLVIALPGILVAVGIGFVILADGLRRARPLLYGVIGAWACLFAVPFMLTAYRSPPDLPLPDADRYEYLSGWTTGYGLRESVGGVIELARVEGKPLTVTGVLGSCNTIRLYIRQGDPITLNCPTIWEAGGLSRAQTIIQHEIALSGSALLLIEDAGPVYESAIPVPNETIARFERPGGGFTVRLVRVTAAGQ